MTIHRSTFQLLRFHFSFFLLPVYLFALSQAKEINVFAAVLTAIIWHLLVYPSSNGYNSYMDRDETPVGGLEKPLQPTKQLYYFTVAMDLLAVSLSFLVSYWLVLGTIIYILASRAYSFRGIRLKKLPLTGFLTVFILQGAHVYYFSVRAIDSFNSPMDPLPPIIASLLIGALYPLTQVYQHEADEKDGVRTISMLLGKMGSFVFSMILFISATFLMFLLMKKQENLTVFYYFLLIMLPVVSFFLYWMVLVWRKPEKADFRNSTIMNITATLCTTAFFILLNFYA